MIRNKLPEEMQFFHKSIIPNDWEIKELGDIFEYINTPSFSRENLTYEKTANEVHYIHYGDIHATYKSELLDFAIETRVPFLKDEFCSENLNFLKEGDLIIADASEDYQGIGESIEIKNIGNKKVVGGLHTLVIRDKISKTSNGFRTYLFRNKNVHNEIKKIATGISVYGISKGNLSKLKLLIPPLPEQVRIAEVLSTWDTAISNLKASIINLELRKKWLMQELLSGNKRLKGYSGEWESLNLKNICHLIKDGTHGTHVEVINGIPLLSAKDINNGLINIPSNCRKISIEDFEQIHKNYELNFGDIVVTIVGTIGRAAIIKNYNTLFTFQRSVAIFKINKKVTTEFLYQVFYSDTFINILNVKANASAQAGIYLGELEKIKLKLPSIEEQTAIAQVLQTADSEIQNYKAKLEKLKEQKKGLMQQLLTGKIRILKN